MKTCLSRKKFAETINFKAIDKPDIEQSNLFQSVQKKIDMLEVEFTDYDCLSCGTSYGTHKRGGEPCCDATKEFFDVYDNYKKLDAKQKDKIDKINLLVSEHNGFYDMHQEYILENYIENNQKQMIEKYIDDFYNNKIEGVGVLMYGHPGSGKTHLITGCILEIVSRHSALINSVKVGSFIDIIMSIKNKFQDQYAIIENLLNVDLLLIDDVGKEHITEFNKQIIYSVINGRYERRKITFFTTNCSTAELSEHIDGATVSRLIERNIMIDFRDIKDKRVMIGKQLTKKYKGES